MKKANKQNLNVDLECRILKSHDGCTFKISQRYRRAVSLSIRGVLPSIYKKLENLEKVLGTMVGLSNPGKCSFLYLVG